MRKDKKPDDKTYEELFAEAMAKIPIYSAEWTNLNQSDPGITVLENLSVFQALQQSHMNMMTDGIRLKLLKMMGFEPKPAAGAQVLLRALKQKHAAIFSKGQKFVSGGLCFEADSDIELCQGSIQAFYAERNGQLIDCSKELDGKIPVGTEIFGRHPIAGMCLYIIVSDLPQEGSKLIFHVKTEEYGMRNPSEQLGDLFAEAEWSYFAEDGFEILDCEDETGVFLQDGRIKLDIPQNPPKLCRFQDQEGYLIKCELKRAEYDIPPRVKEFNGFLFEVIQRDTKSLVREFYGSQTIRFQHSLAEEGYFFVYGKEGDSYFEYQEYAGEEAKGRFYKKQKMGYGEYEFEFSGEVFGYRPEKEEGAVRILCCAKELMPYRELGFICGYDDEEFDLPPFQTIEKQSLILVLVPEEEGKGAVFCEGKEIDRWFKIDSRRNKLCVKDCGDFEGCRIVLAEYACSEGESGNIREYNEFEAVGYEGQFLFTNPAKGKTGRDLESVEEVRKRFVKHLNTPVSAVTEDDYEHLAKNTERLCIHKVKAVKKAGGNQVDIIIKPYAREQYPKLSKLYQDIIYKELMEKRLLNTRIRILDPIYLPVHVHAVLYIKNHFENSRELIEETLNRELDFVSGEGKFGETIYFHRIFQAIESLECVEYIYELTLTPQNLRLISRKGLDIIPAAYCLCHPGKLTLELHDSRVERA